MAGGEPEIARAVSESELFRKMRAKADEAEEVHEVEWTQREAREAAAARQRRLDELLEEMGWDEAFDPASARVFWVRYEKGGGQAVETRWDCPSLAELEAAAAAGVQLGGGADPGAVRTSPREGEEGEGGSYYWVGADGQVQGPRPLSEMRAWFAWDHLPQGTLVCPVGSTQYVDITGIPEIVVPEAGGAGLRESSPKPRTSPSTSQQLPPASSTPPPPCSVAALQKSRAKGRKQAPTRGRGGRKLPRAAAKEPTGASDKVVAEGNGTEKETNGVGGALATLAAAADDQEAEAAEAAEVKALVEEVRRRTSASPRKRTGAGRTSGGSGRQEQEPASPEPESEPAAAAARDGATTGDDGDEPRGEGRVPRRSQGRSRQQRVRSKEKRASKERGSRARSRSHVSTVVAVVCTATAAVVLAVLWARQQQQQQQ